MTTNDRTTPITNDPTLLDIGAAFPTVAQLLATGKTSDATAKRSVDAMARALANTRVLGTELTAQGRGGQVAMGAMAAALARVTHVAGLFSALGTDALRIECERALREGDHSIEQAERAAYAAEGASGLSTALIVLNAELRQAAGDDDATKLVDSARSVVRELSIRAITNVVRALDALATAVHGARHEVFRRYGEMMAVVSDEEFREGMALSLDADALTLPEVRALRAHRLAALRLREGQALTDEEKLALGDYLCASLHALDHDPVMSVLGLSAHLNSMMDGFSSLTDTPTALDVRSGLEEVTLPSGTTVAMPVTTVRLMGWASASEAGEEAIITRLAGAYGGSPESGFVTNASPDSVAEQSAIRESFAERWATAAEKARRAIELEGQDEDEREPWQRGEGA
jgi:hypothetical protein